MLYQYFLPMTHLNISPHLFPTINSPNFVLVFPDSTAIHELPTRHRIGKMKLGIMIDPIGESSKHIVRIEPSATKSPTKA